MKRKFDKNNDRLKQLLSERLTLAQKQQFAESEKVEEEMRRQWEQAANKPIDARTKHQIWFKIQRKLKSGSLPQAKIRLRAWQLVAASVAILISVGSYWLISRQPNKMSTDKTVQIKATQNLLHILPDSSKVWMQKGSSIRYASNFGRDRKVWLTGNSLFEVRKHADKTFQVQINQAFIEVKGTAFLVKQSSPTKNEITLFNGKIEFNVQDTGEKITMSPSQRVIHNPVGGHTTLQDINHINWQNGRFHFTDIGLTKLIETINQIYETTITIGKEVDTNTAFTGSIRYDESLEDVIEKICFSLNLSQEKKDGIIKIHN